VWFECFDDVVVDPHHAVNGFEEVEQSG
jgi:hypothetical protein